MTVLTEHVNGISGRKGANGDQAALYQSVQGILEVPWNPHIIK